MEHDRKCAQEVMAAVETHATAIRELQEEHAVQGAEINKQAENTFQHNFTVCSHPFFFYRSKLQEEHESHYRLSLQDYEPTGETPVRSEPDVPSKGMIECLRAMPMETLLEDFRENHPYESSKESKPSLIPRSPLAQRN